MPSENHFNSVLEEIGYNAEKLPLGKLGKSTLKSGFEQLKELSSLIKHPSLAQNKYGRDREDVSYLVPLPQRSANPLCLRSSKSGRTSTIRPSPTPSVAIVPRSWTMRTCCAKRSPCWTP